MFLHGLVYLGVWFFGYHFAKWEIKRKLPPKPSYVSVGKTKADLPHVQIY